MDWTKAIDAQQSTQWDSNLIKIFGRTGHPALVVGTADPKRTLAAAHYLASRCRNYVPPEVQTQEAKQLSVKQLINRYSRPFAAGGGGTYFYTLKATGTCKADYEGRIRPNLAGGVDFIFSNNSIDWSRVHAHLFVVNGSRINLGNSYTINFASPGDAAAALPQLRQLANECRT